MVDQSAGGESDNSNFEKKFLVRNAFSPSAPIAQRDLFAGRADQMQTILEVLGIAGRHAILYGERGVGKTSLAKVISDVISTSYIAPYITCNSTDTFASIWNRVFSEVKFVTTRKKIGFGGEEEKFVHSVLDQTGPVDSIDSVVTTLRLLSDKSPLFITIDEFDRVTDQDLLTNLADTIKALTDHHVRTTLCIVGVADNVSELIGEHESIERNLEQIQVPRMSRAELSDIITKALSTVDMTINSNALAELARISQGLPHYAHLLGQSASLETVENKRNRVTINDVRVGIERALKAVQQSISDKYHEAVSSSQWNMYPQVVLACALAERNEQGYFSQPDVRAPLSELVGRPMEIPSYARHLAELCTEKRGPILVKKGQERRFRYRFANPLMEPYVVMKGLTEGAISE